MGSSEGSEELGGVWGSRDPGISEAAGVRSRTRSRSWDPEEVWIWSYGAIWSHGGTGVGP